MNPETQRHILVVDDDARIRNLLKTYLVRNGYRATAVADAAEAGRCMDAMRFDLLIVDVMMPGETGLALTARLRAGGSAGADIPVLMLTALAETEERIAGLEHGASDYLSKPFDPRELLLRVNNLLRPRPAAPTRSEPPVQAVAFGAFRFEPQARALYRNGERILLTDGEAMLLAQFASAPGRILESQQQESAFYVRINRLRRKIEADPHHPVYLQTVRGRGYVFHPDHIQHEDA